jgi:hypothetical protein
VTHKEQLTVGLLLATVALFAPGFLLHAAPRFPGSLAGSLLGILGATAMVLLLVCSLAKRLTWLKDRVSLRAFLSLHVYAGAVGAVFGILHTGHKYQSPLGMALVTAMLILVLSGFVGRYYLARIGTDIRDQRQELGVLRIRYDMFVANGLAAAWPGVPMPALIAAIADLEDAIDRREALKAACSRWVILHIIAAIVFYPLLALHIWSGIYHGLRWLP